jgi:hypothetical protein
MTTTQITITTENAQTGSTERTYSMTWFTDESNQRDMHFDSLAEALGTIECDVLATWSDVSDTYAIARVETRGSRQQLVIYDRCMGLAGFAVET